MLSTNFATCKQSQTVLNSPRPKLSLPLAVINPIFTPSALWLWKLSCGCIWPLSGFIKWVHLLAIGCQLPLHDNGSKFPLTWDHVPYLVVCWWAPRLGEVGVWWRRTCRETRNILMLIWGLWYSVQPVDPSTSRLPGRPTHKLARYILTWHQKSTIFAQELVNGITMAVNTPKGHGYHPTAPN